MTIFKRNSSYKPTTVCINFKILQSKRAVVKDLEHHFGNLDGYIKRYEIPVSDNISIMELRQQWHDYRDHRRSPLEVFTHSRAMKLAGDLDKILNSLRAQTSALLPSKAHLADQNARAEEMARRPDAEYPTLHPVVEGSDGQFTITFKEGQYNLDRGGFAQVYIGHDQTGRKLALKCPLTKPSLGDEADQERRMLRESQHWRELAHEFILPFLGTCRISGRLLLVSPYMNNGTLLKYTVKHPEADVARLLHEVATAIAFLHGQDPSVIHGDINGSNILVSDDVHALLCDFGLTKSSAVETSYPLKGVGTLDYIAPELGLEETPKTLASDIYAFGITVAAIFKGDGQPFRRGYLPGNDEPLPVSPNIAADSGQTRAAVWALARLCWSADPHSRPAIAEVADKLDAIVRLE